MMKTKHTLVHISLLLRFVATRESYLIVRRQPLFRPLVHYIIVRPAIEVGWLDILLAQQRGYLRTMIDCVVDGLDHHDDDRSIIGPPVKMEDLTQLLLLHLLRERDQRFSRPLCTSPQFVEVWKMREVPKWRGRDFPSQCPRIAFFGSEHVHKGLSHTAKRPFRGSVQLCVGQVYTRVEQTQVRPEVILKKVGKSCGHCSDFLP